MSSAFSFMIHNEDLIRLSELYLTMKASVIESNRFRNLNQSNSYLTNPTLLAVRDLIMRKLSGELRAEYLEVYDGDENTSEATTQTTYSEWYHLKRRASELDLEEFFDVHTYNLFHYDEKQLDEEREADENEAKEFHSDWLTGEFFKEQLKELKKK